ncbi:hypothetical protein RB195_007411 [Necator americanus]|uniref:Uncharacterized protein n=1 Tax=Necator americanus TaxID=51031 RepID=A0ABR1C0E5_NECAM
MVSVRRQTASIRVEPLTTVGANSAGQKSARARKRSARTTVLKLFKDLSSSIPYFGSLIFSSSAAKATWIRRSDDILIM